MKKIVLRLCVMFIILTFLGIAYILLNKGKANAGFSVVPMVLAMTCLASYRAMK